MICDMLLDGEAFFEEICEDLEQGMIFFARVQLTHSQGK